jgi:hypothetical protein
LEVRGEDACLEGFRWAYIVLAASVEVAHVRDVNLEGTLYFLSKSRVNIHIRYGGQQDKYLILGEDGVDRIIIVIHAVNNNRVTEGRNAIPDPRSGLPRLFDKQRLPASCLKQKMLVLWFAARSLALSRVSLYRPVQRQAFRTFSTTARRLATEVPDDFINAIKHTALFQKLADKPNALKALSDLYALTKEMGAVLSLSLSSCAR